MLTNREEREALQSKSKEKNFFHRKDDMNERMLEIMVLVTEHPKKEGIWFVTLSF